MNPTDIAEVPVKGNEPEVETAEGSVPKEEPRGIFKSLKERAFGSSRNILKALSTVRQENPTADLSSEQNELDVLASQLQQETEKTEGAINGAFEIPLDLEVVPPVGPEAAEPSIEVKEAHQVVNEIVNYFKNWDEIKNNLVVNIEDTDFEEASARLEKAQKTLITINTLGREWSEDYGSSHYHRASEYYGLDEVVADAKENISDKKKLLEASASIPLLDTHITDLALKATGVNSIEELKEKGKGVNRDGGNLFRNVSPDDSEILWQIIEPHVRKVLGDHPDFVDESSMKNVGTVWSEYTIAPRTSERIAILKEVIEKASSSGSANLVQVAQTEIAYLLSGEVRSLPSNNAAQNTENDKYRMIIDEKGRKELLRSAVTVASSLDGLSLGDSNIKDLAQTIGVDRAELVSVVGGSYDSEFVKRIMSSTLEVPFTEQQEEMKKYVAEYFANPQFVARNLRTYMGAAEELGMKSEDALRALSASLKSDSDIAQEISGEIRAMDILAGNPNILAAFEKNDFNMERLVSKIAQANASDNLAAQFDKVLGDSDEVGLIWEYFRLDGANQADRFFRMTPAEHVPMLGSGIPGLPNNLQWSTMRQSDKERFTSDRSFDGADNIPVDKLSAEGQAILIKNIVREVLGRSQNHESKAQAENRNMLQASEGQAKLHAGDLLHGTNIKYLHAILHGGDRAGEFLGFDDSRDMTPVGCDFSMVLPTDEAGEFVYEKDAPFNVQAVREAYKSNPFKAMYSASIAVQYGAREADAFTSIDADSNEFTGVTLIFGRNREDAFLKGAEYQGHMREHHRLVPVGLPGTEISGLIVNGQATKTIEQAKTDIMQNGFYIPIYDIEGALIFTPEDYDGMKTASSGFSTEQVAA